jgi:transposase
LGVPAAVFPEVKDREEGVPVVAVMIGIDPHKASHTAVAINAAEEPLGQLRVRACAAQVERLLAWAQAWPERTWAVEGAGGVGHLLAQQLLGAGERVLDVPPKMAARVRLLATGDINKNDRAPRGVLLYRPPSGQRLEEVSLDLMAYS